MAKWDLLLFIELQWGIGTNYFQSILKSSLRITLFGGLYFYNQEKNTLYLKVTYNIFISPVYCIRQNNAHFSHAHRSELICGWIKRILAMFLSDQWNQIGQNHSHSPRQHQLMSFHFWVYCKNVCSILVILCASLKYLFSNGSKTALILCSHLMVLKKNNSSCFHTYNQLRLVCISWNNNAIGHVGTNQSTLTWHFKKVWKIILIFSHWKMSKFWRCLFQEHTVIKQPQRKNGQR